MESQNLKNLFMKKREDYIYLSLFFIVFSVFVVFIIRPSLTEAFALKKEEADLRQLDKRLGQAIVNILSMQRQLEEHRNGLPLLAEAIPNQPKINKIISDISAIKKDDSVVLEKINVEEVSLTNKSSEKKRQIIVLKLEISSTYEHAIQFIKDIFNQRRIKSIQRIQIQKEGIQATDSANLHFTVELEGYYL